MIITRSNYALVGLSVIVSLLPMTVMAHGMQRSGVAMTDGQHTQQMMGAHHEHGMMGDQSGYGMMGGQFGHGMMGGQFGHGMMGDQFGYGMMGGQFGHGMMGGQFGHGMMGDQFGHGMMGGQFGYGMWQKLSMLDLSDEQRNQINSLQDTFRKKTWELAGLLLDQQTLLRDALLEDKPDAPAVGAIYKEIFDVRRQMIEAQIHSQNEIRDILSAEQLDQLEKLFLPRFDAREESRD